MGKKSRKSSKTKKEKSKAGDKPKKGEKSETVTKTPKYLQIDPDLLKELTKDLNDIFRFPNGDVYLGQFAVTADGGVVRQGRGKYLAVDGVAFCGRWEEDVLVEAERLSFPDGSWYTGLLETGRYAGIGAYELPRLGALRSNFMQGRPLGLSILTDQDGQVWQGSAVPGALNLLPRNHLFDSEDALCRAAACDQKDSVKSQKRSSGSQLETRNHEDVDEERSSKLLLE